MGGVDSELYDYFRSLLIKGFIEIRKNLEDIITIIDIVIKGKTHLLII